jgi:hypothetical protein
MSEGRAWRVTLLACVVAACVTAIACCWLQRPRSATRYQFIQTELGGFHRFDRTTGRLKKIRSQPTDDQETSN